MEQRQEQTQRMTLSTSQLFQLTILEESFAELEEHVYRIIRRTSAYRNNLSKTIDVDFGRVADRVASFEATLLQQIRLESVRQEIGYMAEQLMTYLDTDGLLRTTDAQLATLLEADVSLVKQARHVLQRCEPTGIAARSAHECRLLHALELDDALLIDVATDLNEGIAVKQVLQDIDDATDRIRIKAALDRLPKAPVLPETTVLTIPEADIEFRDGELTINWSDLEIDRSWADLDEAKPFLSAYERRRTTLRAILDVIIERQLNWFKGKLELAPLTKKEVAEVTGHHPSTVGRAIANKTVKTIQGTMLLEDFFVSRTTTGTSSFLVKVRIAQLLEASPVPMSDQQLTDRLTAEEITVARRTVAKYRAALGLTQADFERREENS
ncbi:RNA polymerase subunit sigma-54 [Exiguobacterium sp. s95]|uniref:RNA polymerase factor sigma-54 n=1 Tax=Exiguobacterium sp. s95 TaxID=2751211 RepID=UPI001BEB7C98|nr:RNA polymerase subunit sigma-54 [Exiguobacterium sp. s95]